MGLVMRGKAFVAAAAGVGAFAALAGASASLASSVGLLPAILFQKTWLWKDTISLWGVPIQLFIASWFLTVVWVFRRGVTASAATMTWLSACVVLALCIWIAVARIPPLTVLVSGCAAALVFLLVAGGYFRRVAWTEEALRERRASQRGLSHVLIAVSLFIAAVSVARVTASLMPEATATERNLRRWWASRHSDRNGSAPGLNGESVEVIAFVSHGWQPFRNNFDERIEAIQGFRDAGLNIHFSSRAFPLDPRCNRALRTMTMISEAACEAAYAVSHVRAQLGDDEARMFEQWLIARGTVLDARLIRLYLAQRDLLEGFVAGYDELQKVVESDVALARRLRVLAAPAFVIDGVVVPNTSVALRTILAVEVERRGRRSR
jgi:hypothetical protein